MATLPRTLHPALNAPGLMAAAGAIYAGVSMAYNAYNHRGAWSTPVFIALVSAVASLLTRFVVTPTGDPKDGNGNPLVPAPAAAPLPPDAGVHAVPPPA
jgi:hypothetical protein